MRTSLWGLIGIFIFISGILSSEARSHCDTMNGPVVKDARRALEQGDVTPVLKWVKPEFEEEVRRFFEKTRAVRNKGADVREVADMHFFETVVRLHRAGEGEPYTGLKPEGTAVEPGIEAADQSIAQGNVDSVIAKISGEIAEAIRSRFERVQEAKKHAAQSVELGRSYVAAYVEFIHFIEGLQGSALARQDHTIDTQETDRHPH